MADNREIENLQRDIQKLQRAVIFLRNQSNNTIKYGVTTGVESSTDDSQMSVFQVSYMGKTADTLIYFPYGMFANLPKDQLIVLQSVGGEEENRAGLGSGNPKDRPVLADGEMALFHPATKAQIHFKNNSEIEITSTQGGDININGDGDVNIVGGGKVNLGSGGNDIARRGDTVRVTITTGSSAGIANGTITSGGDNTST